MTKANDTLLTEMTLTRVIHAPVELVWEVCTNPQHLQHWWGPKGFTNPVCEWQAVAGKKVYIDMKGPDGTRYPMDGKFQVVNKPQKLVFTSAALDKNGKGLFEILNTLQFSEKDGNTEIMIHASVSNISADGEKYIEGMNEGWNQSIDKLENYVAIQNRELVFQRLLDAPRELVWEAWTNSEYLAQWWGPNGFTLTTQNMDVTPGGIWRFIMHGPDGRDYPNKIQFLEVKKPERLVYRHMDDGETEPVSFKVTVTMKEVKDKTELTMRMVFASAEDLVRVSREYGAIEGAHQTISRLDALLQNIQK